MQYISVLAFVCIVASASNAVAHSDSVPQPLKQTRQEQKPWGIAGSAKAVSRTIEIVMTDNMRFAPQHIEVRQGETIRLIHINNGNVMHEFVLGTRNELEQHAALMKKFPGMEHDEPYMAHVPRNARGQVLHCHISSK